jgi:hypothetical protein
MGKPSNVYQDGYAYFYVAKRDLNVGNFDRFSQK